MEEERPVFQLKNGIFKTIHQETELNQNVSFFLIVDEINWGDISRIFGELITPLEMDKRGKKVVLPISGTTFSVSKNFSLLAP